MQLHRYANLRKNLLQHLLRADIAEKLAHGVKVASPLHTALTLSGRNANAVEVYFACGEGNDGGGNIGEVVEGGEAS
jgi:hypothetical protein